MWGENPHLIQQSLIQCLQRMQTLQSQLNPVALQGLSGTMENKMLQIPQVWKEQKVLQNVGVSMTLGSPH